MLATSQQLLVLLVILHLGNNWLKCNKLSCG